ncbi:PREDICTED: testis-specific Y-encoded-like protein 1 [Chinchilla lanigera]|uniref:testis-specific Y-encoded-like protein 1 n=1 Tax=Chinchilla lanigera TaxID=34839 RepID=UPI0006974107|nr:PREDICTED: testis-specific Y-encoded-like protein 1 [Chinchilla lanigera]
MLVSLPGSLHPEEASGLVAFQFTNATKEPIPKVSQLSKACVDVIAPETLARVAVVGSGGASRPAWSPDQAWPGRGRRDPSLADLQPEHPWPALRAPGDPDRRLTLRRDPEVTQVMAEAGEGSQESPRLSEEAGVPGDPTDCGRAAWARVDAGRGRAESRAQQKKALLSTGGLAIAAELAAGLATDGRPKTGAPDGAEALQTRAAERRASEGTGRPKGEGATAEKCAESPGAVEEEAGPEVGVEEGMEQEEGAEAAVVVEAPVGEEKKMAEEDGSPGEVKEAGPWALNMDLYRDPLEAIQLELDTVNAQADRAFQHLEQKFGRMHRHYLERRNYIIQSIPGFWMTAFRNHPQLSAMVRGQDADMLRYVTNLEVKELRHPRTGCKFKFFFRRNPYFRNKLIVKEFEVRSSGRVVSLSTPIIWRRGHEPQTFIRRNQDLICSFFTWFSDHSLPESDRIAEIIKEDLWPDPLQYYLLREGVRRARRRPLREPVEIPRPFGFQSG